MDVFERIYRRNLWNGIETRSGPGSGAAATTHLRELLPKLVEELGVTNVVDAGCGEGSWQPPLPGYVGLDVSAEALTRAQQLYPDRIYLQWDLTAEQIHVPAGGLVICRDVIQHLSLSQGRRVLDAIRHSGSNYLLASTYVGGQNVSIETGDCYSPNLEAPPFSMPIPLRMIPDGYDYADPDRVRDPSKYLGLWAL